MDDGSTTGPSIGVAFQYPSPSHYERCYQRVDLEPMRNSRWPPNWVIAFVLGPTHYGRRMNPQMEKQQHRQLRFRGRLVEGKIPSARLGTR